MLISYTAILSVLQAVQVHQCCAALVKTTPVPGPVPVPVLGPVSVMSSAQMLQTAVLTSLQPAHNVSYKVQCFHQSKIWIVAVDGKSLFRMECITM